MIIGISLTCFGYFVTCAFGPGIQSRATSRDCAIKAAASNFRNSD